MSTRHFLKPSICATLLLAMFSTLPALAQTTGQATQERVLDRTELLPHLETIRRQYPRLYERLRREVPQEQLQQAMSASASTAAINTTEQDGKLQSTMTAEAGTQGRTAATRAVPIEALLRQEVRSRSTQASPPTKTSVGATR